MGDYDGLAAAFTNRKQDYLSRMNSPDGTAIARGYLIGKHFGHEGKRPTASPEAQKAAQDRVDKKLSTWYDDADFRAAPPIPVIDEDVNHAIGRLTLWAQSADEAKSQSRQPPNFAIPFPPEPSSLDSPLDVHKLVWVASDMGVWLPDQIRDVITKGIVLPDASIPDQIINAIMNAIPLSPDQQYQVTADTPAYVASIAHLLPKDLVEIIASIRYIKATGGLGSSDDDLPPDFKAAVNLLASLGDLDGLPPRRGFVELAKCLPNVLPQSLFDTWIERINENVFAFALLYLVPNVAPPDGWQWPDWNAAGFYWWRAVLMRHLIQHLLAYADTSDFHANDLLRFYFLFCRRSDTPVPSYVITDIKLAFRLFKYWIDEPAQVDLTASDAGNVKSGHAFLVIPTASGTPQGSEMTFWSENHQILFASAQYLAGQLFPDETFPTAASDPNNVPNGQTMMDQAKVRIQRWLDNRLRFGLSEWSSPGYVNEDLTPLFNLFDFLDTSQDTDVLRMKTKVGMILDLILFDFARRTCGGSFGVTAGRAYGQQKFYGWNQAAGDVIELLFGLRGDYLGGEPATVALATSTYDVPQVLLAIARDRLLSDRKHPLVDRSRISINFDEGDTYGIGFDSDDDVVYWWGNGAFFADKVLESTKRLVEAHPNLRYTSPFNLLYKFEDPLFSPVIYDLVETAAGALVQSTAFAGVLLPFPLNILSWTVGAAGVEMELEGLYHLLLDIGATLVKVGKKVLHAITFGLVDDSDDDKPKIPDSAIRKTWEAMLVKFNAGSSLTRANLYTYTNGDAMLSSVQKHYPGEFAAQKHAWQATLGCDASVWTTSPMVATTSLTETQARAWLEFFKSLAVFSPTTAVVDLYLSTTDITDQFAKDGPNVWTGSLAMPMAVQFENAAIIAYNLPNLQRVVAAPTTHAWFPKQQFDEVLDPIDQNDGTWFFGRKDSYDPDDQPMPDPDDPTKLKSPGTRLGSGYVALFSARQARWTSEGPWTDKELSVDGGSNIWVCLVGNEAAYGSFDNFKQHTLNSYLHISGVGSPVGLECTFDIPNPNASPGTAAHRLELFYNGGDDGEAHLDGKNLPLDDFARFENPYVQYLDRMNNRLSSGSVPFDSTYYSFNHASTGLWLVHDTEALKEDNFRPDDARRHNHQDDSETIKRLNQRRLWDGTLTTQRIIHRSKAAVQQGGK